MYDLKHSINSKSVKILPRGNSDWLETSKILLSDWLVTKKVNLTLIILHFFAKL